VKFLRRSEMRTRLVVLALPILLAVFAGLAYAQADKPSVTGGWTLTIESPNGTFNPVVIFKQDGEKLTGTYKGRAGDTKLDGTITGKDIKWTVKLQFQDQTFELEYKGTVDGDSMKGTVAMGEMGTMPWTAKRKKD
jgi:L-seryl-tRNA(Ser) seleniumtransferase